MYNVTATVVKETIALSLSQLLNLKKFYFRIGYRTYRVRVRLELGLGLVLVLELGLWLGCIARIRLNYTGDIK